MTDGIEDATQAKWLDDVAQANRNQPLEDFMAHCESGQEIFKERNAAYGSSYKSGGLLLVLAEIRGIVGRLTVLIMDALISREKPHWDKIKDALVDLHNYANIGLLLADDEELIGEL